MSLNELSSPEGLTSSNLVGRAIKYARCTALSPRKGEKKWNLVFPWVIHAYWFVAGVIDARIRMT